MNLVTKKNINKNIIIASSMLSILLSGGTISAGRMFSHVATEQGFKDSKRTKPISFGEYTMINFELYNKTNETIHVQVNSKRGSDILSIEEVVVRKSEMGKVTAESLYSEFGTSGSIQKIAPDKTLQAYINTIAPGKTLQAYINTIEKVNTTITISYNGQKVQYNTLTNKGEVQYLSFDLKGKEKIPSLYPQRGTGGLSMGSTFKSGLSIKRNIKKRQIR